MKLTVSPAGAPVALSVTGKEKPAREVTVVVVVADAPWTMLRLAGATEIPKSGVVSVSLAILLVEDSSIHALPAASITTSCGWLPAPNGHSLNWPVMESVMALVAGATVAVEGSTGPVIVVTSAPATGANGVIPGATGPETTPPADGSS